MPEYIEREALIEKISSISITIMGMRSGRTLFNEALKSYREAVLKNIKEAPTADVVPSAVLEQVMWERDMALETLKEHGIGFCEKSDVGEVVRCKDCQYGKGEDHEGSIKVPFMYHCTYDDLSYNGADHYCSYGKRKEGAEE